MTFWFVLTLALSLQLQIHTAHGTLLPVDDKQPCVAHFNGNAHRSEQNVSVSRWVFFAAERACWRPRLTIGWAMVDCNRIKWCSNTRWDWEKLWDCKCAHAHAHRFFFLARQQSFRLCKQIKHKFLILLCVCNCCAVVWRGWKRRDLIFVRRITVNQIWQIQNKQTVFHFHLFDVVVVHVRMGLPRRTHTLWQRRLCLPIWPWVRGFLFVVCVFFKNSFATKLQLHFMCLAIANISSGAEYRAGGPAKNALWFTQHYNRKLFAWT